jgi:hypothetical protein
MKRIGMKRRNRFSSVEEGEKWGGEKRTKEREAKRWIEDCYAKQRGYESHEGIGVKNIQHIRYSSLTRYSSILQPLILQLKYRE